MSQPKIILRALPNVEFVHGYPGIPASPERPQATIRGSLELRLGQQPVKAKWVKVELRKIETIPGHGSRNDDFVDIIGKGPVCLWQAKAENELLPSRDIPFTLQIPETIPSSVALKNGLGIRYEVMATLCMKGKKGIFRRDASVNITHSVAVVIDKHELHSTWPIYAQPESRQITRDVDGLILVVDRGNTCFGPGDRILIIATLKSDNLTPIVIRGFEFYLVEVVTFIAGQQPRGKHKGGGSNTGPTINVLGEYKVPLSLTLYGGTQHRTELGCIVPPSHTTSSINTARHIDVTYKMKIKVLLDFLAPVEVELPVTLTNWPRNVSAEIVRRIGATPNLSPKVAPTPRVVPAVSAVTHNLGPPGPPPTGALPSIPDIPPAVPAKNDPTSRVIPAGGIITPPSISSSSTSNTATPMTLFSASSTATSMTSSQRTNELSKNVPEPSYNPGISSNIAGVVDELGYVTTTNGNSSHAATAPARVIRVSSQRNNVTESESLPEAEVHALPGSSSSSIGRRNRGMSRLKVMNANDDIPEEPSPVQHNGSSASGAQTHDHVRARSGSLPGTKQRKWLSAEEEKRKLYDNAKARVEAHGRTRSQERVNDSGFSSLGTTHSNLSSTSVEKQRPGTASGTSPAKSGWMTAEEEKRRLFDEAQARVRQTQGLGPMSPVSPTISITPTKPNGVSHAPSTTPASVSDLYSVGSSYTLQSQPSQQSMSRGAALYSHAINSLARANSATASPQPQQSTGQPRRNASAIASNATSVRPGSSRGTTGQTLGASNIPQEAPISYEELFGDRPSVASSSNEKDMLRQRYDAEDSAARQAAGTPPQRAPSTRSQRPPPVPPSQQPLSEKEVMRRAFEARDAALLAAGQVPPPMIVPSASSLQRSTSVTTPAVTVTSLPPSYDTGGFPGGRHLTAAEEKAQLADQYGTPSSPNLGAHRSATSTPDPHIPNLTREKSTKSDTSEGFLRRDPSISAGKKRASQLQPITTPAPPPLPPRPPQEYIEETKEQDRRTTLLSSSVQLPSSYDGADSIIA